MHIHHEPSNTAATAPRFPVARNVARRMSSRDIAPMVKDLQVDALSFEHIYRPGQVRLTPKAKAALVQHVGGAACGR